MTVRARGEAVMAHELVRSFEFGRVFSRTFATLYGGFAKVFGIALVIEIPIVLLLVAAILFVGGPAVFGGEVEEVSDDAAVGIIVTVIAFAILMILSIVLVQAATVNAAIRHLRGEPVSVLRCLALTGRRLRPLIGVVLVQMAAYYGGFALVAPLFLLPAVGTVVGVVALIVVFVLVVHLFLRWWVVVPVVVAENAGVLEALSRSARLTAGRRWTVLGLLLVLWLVAVAATVIIPLPFELIAPGSLGNLASFVVNVAVVAMFAVATAIGYHDLRIEKDGLPSGDIAAVFD